MDSGIGLRKTDHLIHRDGVSKHMHGADCDGFFTQSGPHGVRLHLQGLLHRLITIELQIALNAGGAFAEAVRDHLDFVGM